MSLRQWLHATATETARQFLSHSNRRSARRHKRNSPPPHFQAERLEPRQLLTVAPFVESINRTSPAGPATNASSVTYTVTFNEAVTGVSAVDFRLVTSGSLRVNVPLNVIATTSSSYAVTSSGISGSGTLGLNFIDNGTVQGTNGASLHRPSPSMFGAEQSIPQFNADSLDAVVDVNGDGEPDLIGVYDQQIEVAFGNGDGTFQNRVLIPTGTSVYQVAVADINGDGRPDLVCVGSDQIGIMLGNGNGTFQAWQTVESTVVPIRLAVGDVNNDGRPDILFSGTEENPISVWLLLGNGNGTFQSPRPVTTSQGLAFQVQLADLNADGKLDLVLPDQQDTGVLLGNGNGTFAAEQFVATGSTSSATAIADVNGDGLPDMAVVDLHTNTVNVLLGNGNGSFSAPQTYAVGNEPLSVAAADMNGDGKTDLIVTNWADGTVGVLLGNGNGSFQQQKSFVTDPSVNGRVTAADINGDGRPDILLGNYDGLFFGELLSSTSPDSFTGQTFTIQQIYPHVVSITSGTSPDPSDSQFDVTFSEPVTGVDPTDFQVVTGGAVAYGGISVTPVSGSVYTVNVTGVSGVGTLGLNLVDDGTIRDANGNPLLQSVPANAFQNAVSVPSISFAYAMELADVNDDSKTDLVSLSSSGLGVMLGNGNGTFQSPIYTSTGLLGQSLAVADLNGDGIPDAVIYDGFECVIFLGNGNGTFRESQFYTINTPASGTIFPDQVLIADVTGDGIPDIALADSNSGAISILVGNGDGTFQSQRTFAAPITGDLRACDLNGDGNLDIAFAGSNSIGFALGNGDGTFQPPQTIAVTPNKFGGFAVSDVNGDGRQDLLVALNRDLEIFLGNGDGTFAAPINTPIGYTQSLAVADINGDGIPDAIISDFGSQTTGVLLGNGDGTFKSPQPFTSLYPPVAVYAGDLTGDGRPDLLEFARFSFSATTGLLAAQTGSFAGQAAVVGNLPSIDAISGSPGADQIVLTADLDGQHVDWTLGASAGQFTVNDPNGLTITGNGSNDVITLNYANGNPLPAILHLNGTFTINGLVGTNPLAGTTLDIGRSTVFLSYGASDPIAAIKGYLQAGYNGGAWNGTATPSTGVITSSAAAANPNHTTAIGFADSGDFSGVNTTANSIELKYTLVGDANLDGQVNSADLQILLAELNRQVNGWDQADFNYDGNVNSADLQDLLFTLNTNLGSQAAAATAPTTAVASAAVTTPATKSGAGGTATRPPQVAAVQTPVVTAASTHKRPQKKTRHR
jgi:hypothetical protein